MVFHRQKRDPSPFVFFTVSGHTQSLNQQWSAIMSAICYHAAHAGVFITKFLTYQLEIFYVFMTKFQSYQLDKNVEFVQRLNVIECFEYFSRNQHKYIRRTHHFEGQIFIIDLCYQSFFFFFFSVADINRSTKYWKSCID